MCAFYPRWGEWLQKIFSLHDSFTNFLKNKFWPFLSLFQIYSPKYSYNLLTCNNRTVITLWLFWRCCRLREILDRKMYEAVTMCPTFRSQKQTSWCSFVTSPVYCLVCNIYVILESKRPFRVAGVFGIERGYTLVLILTLISPRCYTGQKAIRPKTACCVPEGVLLHYIKNRTFINSHYWNPCLSATF